MPITVEEAYRVLELEIGAPEEHVKKQYKRLALKTHPDKNPDDPEAGKKFLLISEAYKRITDPDSFKDEDDQGDMPANEEEMEAMFNEMLAEMFGFSGFHGAHVPFELFQMFESMMPDDEEDEYPGEGMFFSMPSGFPGGRPMMFAMHDEDDDDDDEEGDEFYYMDEDDDDEDAEYFMSGGGNDLFEAMLLNEILGGRGGPGMAFPSARPKLPHGKAATSTKGKDNAKAAKKNKKNNKKESKVSAQKEEGKNNESSEKNKTQSKATNKAPSKSKTASSMKNAKEEEDWETADEDEEEEEEEEIQRFQGRKPAADSKSSSSNVKTQDTGKKKPSPTNGSSIKANASKKTGKGKPSKYFEDDDDDDMNDQDLMEMMMNHMAMELGIPGGGDMLQFLMESELVGDDDEDDDDDDDGRQSSKKAKKKKNNKKKNKKSNKDTIEAVLLPPSFSSSVPSSSASKRNKEEERLPAAGDDSIPSLESVSTKENLPQPSTAPSSSSSPSANGIKVGDHVLVSKKHQGRVAFIGDVHYAKGIYVGVVMKDPTQGKNSGTVRGVEYFRCKPSERGLMVPLMDVTLVR